MRLNTIEGLKKIYNAAQQLSVTIKRDVLSVRMAVTIPNTSVFDAESMEALWEDMGHCSHDFVIGAAGFGLLKFEVNELQERIVLRCKVVSSSLLRHLGFRVNH